MSTAAVVAVPAFIIRTVMVLAFTVTITPAKIIINEPKALATTCGFDEDDGRASSTTTKKYVSQVYMHQQCALTLQTTSHEPGVVA